VAAVLAVQTTGLLLFAHHSHRILRGVFTATLELGIRLLVLVFFILIPNVGSVKVVKLWILSL
jgi:hypothetical protein